MNSHYVSHSEIFFGTYSLIKWHWTILQIASAKHIFNEKNKIQVDCFDEMPSLKTRNVSAGITQFIQSLHFLPVYFYKLQRCSFNYFFVWGLLSLLLERIYHYYRNYMRWKCKMWPLWLLFMIKWPWILTI